MSCFNASVGFCPGWNDGGTWPIRGLGLASCRSHSSRATASPATTARRAVGLVQRLERAHRLGRAAREGALDHLGDRGEAQTAVEERVDGDLVGGVQHARRGAARDGGLAREAQTGERVEIDGLEGERCRPREVERVVRSASAVDADSAAECSA